MSLSTGVQITGDDGPRYDEVLTPDALEFLAELHRSFDGRRQELVAARARRYEELAAGATLGFLDENHGAPPERWRSVAANTFWYSWATPIAAPRSDR